MSRLFKPERKPRVNTRFNARLSVEQIEAANAQSKADRKKIVVGIVQRAAPPLSKRPRWAGLQPRAVEGRYLSASEVEGLKKRNALKRTGAFARPAAMRRFVRKVVRMNQVGVIP